jgi:hypothetical protein
MKTPPARPGAEHKTASGRLRNAEIMIVDRYGRPGTPNCPRSFERPYARRSKQTREANGANVPDGDVTLCHCVPKRHRAPPASQKPHPPAKAPPASQSPTRQPKPQPPTKAPPPSQNPPRLTPTAPPAAARSRRSAHPHPNTATAPAPRRTAPGTAPRTARPPAATPHGTPTPPRARRRSR